mgnify:CR=1 FL=1
MIMRIEGINNNAWVDSGIDSNFPEGESSFEQQLQSLLLQDIPKEDKNKQACRMLEGFLIQEMLKNTRIFQLSGTESAELDMVADMAIEKLADQIVRSGGLGLAENMEKLLGTDQER